MYFKYLKYVLKHKWYVFIECCKFGIPLRGILHDLSKLLPSEFIPYAKYFYGLDGVNLENEYDHEAITNGQSFLSNRYLKCKAKFDRAWLYHQKRNKHHWQYWLLVNDSSSNEFTIQAPGDGYEMYLSRNNRHLAMFDESILFAEDKLKPNFNNDNAWIYAKEIRDRLNKCPRTMEIPDKFRKEMLADWIGAGIAITDKREVKEWYTKNKDNIILHPNTRTWIDCEVDKCK